MKVVYLQNGRREYLGSPASVEHAMRDLRAMKRRGFTVWLETDDGKFFPVPGATRKPLEIV